MIGKLPSPTEARFRRIVELYATMICDNQIVEENIPLINDVMVDIGNDLDVSFTELFEAEQQKCTHTGSVLPVVETAPTVVAQTFGLAEYQAATEAFFREQFIERFQSEIASQQQLIGNLKTKPTGYSGSQKEYRQRNKSRIEKARTLVAELRKKVTRFRNNDLEEPDTKELVQLITREYEATGGTLTGEQRAHRIGILTKLVFESQIYEFYPTPKDIIEEMLLPAADIQPGATVLEPSAGTGNIASAIRETYPDATLHVIEYNDILREILQLQSYHVVGTDTMAYTGQQYDRIVMNPPFDMGIDIVHVSHCYEHLLKPGGRLVAIMSKRAYTDKHAYDSVKFARFVDKHGKAVGISNKRYSEQLERPMTIDVILVELNKPLHVEEVVITYLDATQGNRVKNLATQAIYTVESTGEQYVLRNMATMQTEYLTSLPSNRFELVSGEKRSVKSIPVRSAEKRDTAFKQVSVITARPELTSTAEQNHIRPELLSDIIKPYVIEGANYAIEALERTGGFLLADGTGTGKTIQQLLVADTLLHRYGKPVLIFTESEQIIQQSFFGDARKLGMATPDAQELKEKIAKKPKNYKGLYGLEGAEADTVIYRFDPKTQLKHGINIGTYNDISLMFPNDPLVEQVRKAYTAKRQADREYTAMRQEVRKRKDLHSGEKKAERDQISQRQYNDPRYSNLIAAEDKWFQRQAEYFGVLAQSTCVLIFDECHNLKNTKSGTLRADRGLMLTDNAKRIMFVSATPSDKAGDIFYLRRSGIYRDEEHFKELMQTIGYYWSLPVYNDNGDMIRRGEWKSPDKFPIHESIQGVSRIFDRLTEDKGMLKREIELSNLKKNEMIDIKVPAHVSQLMQEIDDALTEKAEKEGRIRPVVQILMEQKWALEPFKIDPAIEIIEKAVDDGRNVIVFADLKDEGDLKAWGERKGGTIRILKNRLEELYGSDAIGVVVGVESAWEQQQRLNNIQQFQKGEKRIILATISSGGTGISLDDQLGNAPRTIVTITAPMNSIKIIQALGRINRANTQSTTEAYFLFCDVDVDQWLKHIVIGKLLMLGAIVAGQVSRLKPEQIEALEAGGDDAVAAAFESFRSALRPHTLTNAKHEIDGLKLPAKKPFLVRRRSEAGYIAEESRWGTLEFVRVRARTLQDINRWAKEQETFVQKYAMERKSSVHEGTYYEAPFSDELWQAVLNMVQFENIKYTTTPAAIFQVGDPVVALMDILESHVTRGSTGTILQIRPRNGYTLYRVQWSNGNIGETVEQFQLSHPQDVPPDRDETDDEDEEGLSGLSDDFDTYEDYIAELLEPSDNNTDYTLSDSPNQIRFRKILNLWYEAKEAGQFENTVEIEEIIRSIAQDLGMETVLPPSTANPQCPPLDAMGERCITPQCLEKIQECIDAYPQTKLLNIDMETGKYTPERLKLHDKIINSFKEQKPCVQQQPIAILTGGAPGSGKSTFLKKFATWLSSGKLYNIDADAVRSLLPEYKGWNATNTHLETKDIVDRLLQEIGTPCQHDLIYDGTMNKAKNYLPLIDKLKGLGYQTFVIYIRVPKNVSVERALSRYKRTGRFVPMVVIDEIFEAGETAMRTILERVDGYIVVDGLTQEIVERGGIEIPADREYSSITGTPNCCEGMADSLETLVVGATTTIETPGHTITAQYALMELEQVIVSHNPRNFAPNPLYPDNCQQRDYERDPAEQQKVTMGAKHFDPRFALAVTPTATDGAAIVNKERICLGGNGRTMMMRLVPPEVYREKYVTMLREIRCMFGLTLEQIDQFRQPVLVRLVDMQPEQCALFSNILNTSLTQKQDITTRTVSLARQLSPQIVSAIAELFEEADKDTVAQLLASPPIVYRLQKLLREAGIVTDQNVSEFFADSHTFTAEGRLLFEGILLGAILPDRDFIEAARSYTDKLIRTLPLLIRMQRLPDKWNIIPDIQEVIILEAERRASGVPLNLFLQQTTFDREEVKEKTELIWRLLETPALAPWKTFVSRYIRTAEQEVEAEQSGGGFWEEALEPVDVIRRLRKELDNPERTPSSLRDRIDGMTARLRQRLQEALR